MADGDHLTFWERLGPDERATLTRAASRGTFPAGAILCRQGDQSTHVLVLTSGHVRVTRVALDGREISAAGVRGPGDVLGELSAVDALPRSATVSALDAVQTLTIPGARFAHLCQTEPRIAWAVLGVVTDRLRETGRYWAEFGGGHTTQRVAALLLELAAQQGSSGGAAEVTLWAGQHELATGAATSRESVARALRMLREQGLVSTRRNHITIHDIAGLRRVAG
jgi:CRP/FNR family cyclic AMP-dependent transcriptional regulator